MYVSLSCLSALTMWTCEGEAPIQPLMNVGVSRLWSGCTKDGKFPRKRKGAVLSTLEQGLRADDRAGPFGRNRTGFVTRALHSLYKVDGCVCAIRSTTGVILSKGTS